MNNGWQPAALVAGLALAGHLLFSWVLVVPAAAVGGALAERRAWLAGLIGVLLAWTLIVIYSFTVAPAETSEMARVMSALAGGLPALATPVLTLVTAAALGAAGGWFGGALRNLLR